ncbi:MAG TPA: 2-C-methyl-D-erythritol 2,4-cyclodiphosphate synthase [Candidatus Aminicenantes bacterium]|nr:2-C-methyl-D-erythritol 2,4-cyclodiphosphate synthase [Candidatus Aminicenantes bacterium]HDT13962.1 2-C-methyl-D-erythritol 2,4-cyclodiphosphate synthase [Candidatus Aminicenantes bacterium]
MPRIGIGYDIHRLEPGRPLVLGGIEVPHASGLAGHSDGDALVHAVIDALLGALGEGDIGTLFPDTDPRFEGARSLGLLETVMGRLRSRGGTVVNVDTVIVAEEPKMGPYIPAMKAALGPALGLPEAAVGIKAKTNEGLGPVGEKRAIACYAVALVDLPD